MPIGVSDHDAYRDSMSLLEARSRFFERASLGADGGYQDRWVRVKAKPVSFYFLNTRSRVAAAKLHDLHHIATGYTGDWPGESEIAAWEIASGCGSYNWAWILNLGAFFIGLILFPRAVWRAFVRGRHAKNLYHTGLSEENLARITVGELRRMLELESPARPVTAGDRLAFIGWSFVAVAYHIGILAGGLGLALLTYRMLRSS